MSQNLISLNLTEADYAEIADLLTQLENKFSGLIDLTADERRSINKMGGRSEVFCRQALPVLQQNPQVIPPSLDLPEAVSDLGHVDALRIPIARMRQLLGRAEDTEMALGSDVMSAALEGYALLKVMGKGSGLEALRRDMSVRFARSASAKAAAPADAA